MHSHSHSHGHGHGHATGNVLRWSTVLTAAFVAVEIIGGIRAHYLALLSDAGHNFTDAIALLLACNMFVAYWTADREALSAIFSDPGKFYAADPYTFLLASLMVLIFGAGFFAVDAVVAKRLKAVEQ